MVHVDAERVNRWKCLWCGSKQKKILEKYNNSGKIAARSILCCNCGHVDQFAYSAAGVESIINNDENKIAKSEIRCGLFLSDIKYCKFDKCKYRPTTPPPPPPKKEEHNTNVQNSDIHPVNNDMLIDVMRYK